MPSASQLAFFAVCAVSRARCLCDVGSLDGEQALLFRRRLAPKRVIAFEANPANYARIRSNPRVAGAGIELVNAAVTNRSGPIELHVVEPAADKPWAAGVSSLRPRRKEARAGLLETPTEVAGVRLDEYLADEPGPIALWIDVEGAAYEVVEGLSGVADRITAVHVEVETEAVWEGQRTAGHVMQLLDAFGMQPILETHESRHQRNVVLIKTRHATLARVVCRSLTRLEEWRVIVTAAFRSLWRIAVGAWHAVRARRHRNDGH